MKDTSYKILVLFRLVRFVVPYNLIRGVLVGQMDEEHTKTERKHSSSMRVQGKLLLGEKWMQFS